MVTSLLFLVLFSIFKIKDKLIITIIGLLIIADSVDLFYKQPYMIELYAIVKVIAFSILSVFLYSRIRRQKLGRNLKILFVIVVLMNLLIGYKSVTDITVAVDASQLISIQIYWVVCVITAALAAKYYFCNDSQKAVNFIIFTFLFVFTDLCGFIGHFIVVREFFYFERILYSIGFMYLGNYLFFSEEEGEEKMSTL
ncbi:hypothetical protein CW732_17475 [Olleya sp. Bg11-27]|nr:hypothetical protein CW732_17475 [Olleya sp. Bg11-27]